MLNTLLCEHNLHVSNCYPEALYKSLFVHMRQHNEIHACTLHAQPTDLFPSAFLHEHQQTLHAVDVTCEDIQSSHWLVMLGTQQSRNVRQ